MGRVRSILGFFLFFVLLSRGFSSSVSCCPPLLLMQLVLFRVTLLFFSQVLLIFRGSLGYSSFSVASILSVVCFAGCRFRNLLFLASAYFQLCLTRVPLIGSLASLPFCLWVPCFFHLCLSCACSLCLVRLLWCFAPSLGLWFFCRPSSLVTSSSPPSMGLLWFLFIFFVTRSNLGSFATGSSFWAELSRVFSLSTASSLTCSRQLRLQSLHQGSWRRCLLLFNFLFFVCVRSFQITVPLSGGYLLLFWDLRQRSSGSCSVPSELLCPW